MTRYLMNLCTGSVATELDWYNDYLQMEPEEWGGYAFESEDLVEVVLGEEGEWVEAESSYPKPWQFC